MQLSLSCSCIALNRTGAPLLDPYGRACTGPHGTAACSHSHRDMLAEGLRVKQLRVVRRPLPQLPRPLIPQPLDALLQHVLQRGVQLQQSGINCLTIRRLRDCRSAPQ